MLKFILAFNFIFSCFAINAQGVLYKHWDRRYGGINLDELSSFQQTNDGGYILGGDSYSGISGDKTQPNWNTTLSTADYWIVKLDSNGNKQWDKRFGGTSNDFFEQVEQTKDGGYILGGWSSSGISGDKTQPGWGGWDYWIVKIDSLGNKQWDKRFGGFGDDILSSVQQTSDGGYILGGSSNSGIGGDKTQANWDTTNSTNDYWVVKIDSLGNKLWDKRFGGTLVDGLATINQTDDGGYILSGTTFSDSSGDITQPTFGVPDIWIVKIDSLGNKKWDQRFGGISEDGMEALTLNSDGSAVLAGLSYSDVSGNKTAPPCLNGDYWLGKIDSAGIKLWDKVFGSLGSDITHSIMQTQDKGYLVGGYSIHGNAINNDSCDKSENNLGSSQTWIIKIDSNGNKQWDKTILTTGSDVGGYAIQTKDGCYAFANTTSAGIGGYKTQAAWDSSGDYWIIKFCDQPLGINELIADTLQINVYPNPFSTDIAIALQMQDLTEADFTITNMLGQQIYSQHESNLSANYTKMLDLSYLPDGVYLLQMVVDGERVVRRVVKQ